MIAPIIAGLNHGANVDLVKYKDFLLSVGHKARRLARRDEQFGWLGNALEWVSGQRGVAAAVAAPPTAADSSLPEEVEDQARDMILRGEAPPVAWRPFIRRLNFASTRLDSLEPLDELAWLHSLYLDSTQIRDLSALSDLTGLRTLGLKSTPVSDLSELEGMTGLRRLFLDNTQVSNLSKLDGLIRLQRLGLANTRVSDLTPLRRMTALQRLYLSNTRVRDLSALKDMGGLELLHLGGTQISDVSELGGLTSLQELHLNRTQIRDLSALSDLTELQTLDLSSTPVTDSELLALADLTRLKTLDLTSSKVEHASALKHLVEKGLEIRGVPSILEYADLIQILRVMAVAQPYRATAEVWARLVWGDKREDKVEYLKTIFNKYMPIFRISVGFKGQYMLTDRRALQHGYYIPEKRHLSKAERDALPPDAHEELLSREALSDSAIERVESLARELHSQM